MWVKTSNTHRNKGPKNLFPSVCFGTARIYTMPNACLLVEIKTQSQIRYIVLNTKIDYEDPNNAFGELVINNPSNDFSIDPFILRNNTIVRILKEDDDNFSFLPNDLSDYVPKNSSMYVDDNTHIKKVYLSKNEPIPTDTTNINMTFFHPIELATSVNISVYVKYDNGEDQ